MTDPSVPVQDAADGPDRDRIAEAFDRVGRDQELQDPDAGKSTADRLVNRGAELLGVAPWPRSSPWCF
ncbi:MAG: hypothetical protein HC871_09835 [Rhizobiales bacterium]|nr:hypothetical protein [Hyphomicrobiales bacterium]